MDNNDLNNLRVEINVLKSEIKNLKEHVNSLSLQSKTEGEKRNAAIENLRMQLHKLDIFTERINFLELQISEVNKHQTKLLESYMKLNGVSIMENDIEHIKTDLIRQDREFSNWQEQQDAKLDELRKEIFELDLNLRNRIETNNIQNNGHHENFERVDENIKRIDREIYKMKDEKNRNSRMVIPIVCSAAISIGVLVINIIMSLS